MEFWAILQVKRSKTAAFALDNIDRLDTIQAKALCAGIGTSGTCGMFTFGGKAKEKISFGKKEAQSVMDELSTADDADIITLGEPSTWYE